jgi:hypothetical protein
MNNRRRGRASDQVTGCLEFFTQTVTWTRRHPQLRRLPQLAEARAVPVALLAAAGVALPNEVTGCPGIIGPFFGSSDVDFDGTSYWADWPDSTTPGTFPAPFFQQQPTTNGGTPYPQMQFETDAPASEATCMPTGQGCAVPPPGAPGNFYPYWTQATVGGHCVWEFGQMTNGNTFGADAQYDGPSARFFGTLASPIMTNPTCQ